MADKFSDKLNHICQGHDDSCPSVDTGSIQVRDGTYWPSRSETVYGIAFGWNYPMVVVNVSKDLDDDCSLYVHEIVNRPFLTEAGVVEAMQGHVPYNATIVVSGESPICLKAIRQAGWVDCVPASNKVSRLCGLVNANDLTPFKFVFTVPSRLTQSQFVSYHNEANPIHENANKAIFSAMCALAGLNAA